jgi:hypothetical protein
MAGLGYRYLVTTSSFKFGHPLRKPIFSAFMRVEIFGLHSNWCENLTALARVRAECMNPATCICRGFFWMSRSFPTVNYCLMASDVIGSVQRSVWGSLYPLKINFPLYMTSQYFSVNITLQPALHRILMPTKDSIVNLGQCGPWGQ